MKILAFFFITFHQDNSGKYFLSDLQSLGHKALDIINIILGFVTFSLVQVIPTQVSQLLVRQYEYRKAFRKTHLPTKPFGRVGLVVFLEKSR